MSFIEHLVEVKARKGTMLCIGLDPALPNQRTLNTIPHTYDVNIGVNNARLRFCLDIIHVTKEFCCAYKPNQQYFAGFTRL